MNNAILRRSAHHATILLTLGLLAPTLLSTQARAQADGRGGRSPGNPIGFTLDPGIGAGALPARAEVFGVITPAVTPAWVEARALQLFGMVGSASDIGGGLLELRQDRAAFSVEVASGAWNWRNLDFTFTAGRISETDSLPTLDDAKIIADLWLAAHGGMPPDSRFTRSVVNPGCVSVGYQRVSSAANHPNWGAGARIIVDVGSNGAVVGASVAWPEYYSIGTYSLITITSALAAARSGNAIYLGRSDGVLTDPLVVYLADPGAKTHVRPHVRFLVDGNPDHEVLVDLLPADVVLP